MVGACALDASEEYFSYTSFGEILFNDAYGLGDVDFNNDGVFPDNQDIVDFLAVFAGGECVGDGEPCRVRGW